MDASITTIPAAEGPVSAWFEDPTTRYPHGVLGDAVEAGTLAVQLASDCAILRATLPTAEVFEDIAPRLSDLDGDGRAEVIVVQSHRLLGARLAIYSVTDRLRLLAATPNIGRPNRWLAPIGVADLDGDGAIEIAYIDRPHLARTLRVWRYENGALTEIAAASGLTNHRIGDPFISGGVRDCDTGPEMLTANADWTRIIATRLTAAAALVARDLGPFTRQALDAALICRD
jgi:hypothetical protein